MFFVVIKHIDTTSRPKGKRFDTIVTEVSKPNKEKAWKLVLDTQRKASNCSTIALVDIIVLDKNHKPVWQLH